MTGFEWCPSKDLVQYIWSAGDPQNSNAPEYAVAFNLDQRATRNDILVDVSVTADTLYACEVGEKTRKIEYIILKKIIIFQFLT
jgi:hypothetical protein